MKIHNKVHFFANGVEQVGVVEKTVSSKARGRVSYNGSHWFATLSQENGHNILQKGEVVKVVGRKGITLLVSPLP